MKGYKKCTWCKKMIKLTEKAREMETGGYMHEDCVKAHGFEIISKNRHAQELGKLGGQATLKKYGKEKMKEWGKKGGRPKKTNEKTNQGGNR